MQIKHFTALKTYKYCIKIRQNNEVQKDVNTRQKFNFGIEPKNNNASSHMLLNNCHAFGFLL